MARIFIAAAADDVAATERILERRHELCVVSTTMAEALAKLQEQAFDLIMVGVHFNESRIFELLGAIHKTPEYADTPVICFCTRDTPLTRTMHESIDVASKALGAWMYLDQHEFNVTNDPDAEMRRIIERCLTGEVWKKKLASRVDIHKQREELLQLRQALEDKELSLDLEDRVADLREKLSEVLLELSHLQITTSKQSPEELEEGLDAGADDYMAKPIRLRELSVRVRAIMRHRSQIATNESVSQQAFCEKEGLNRNKLFLSLLATILARNSN